jgi:TM2 domain-containing membrane protein YozV
VEFTTKHPDDETREMYSPKSYAVAVCLVAVFGTVGVHHFYLGRWLHGALDLSLVIVTIGFLFIFWPLSVLTLILDVIHTVYFMYKLVVGEYKDGAGRFLGISS